MVITKIWRHVMTDLLFITLECFGLLLLWVEYKSETIEQVKSNVIWRLGQMAPRSRDTGHWSGINKYNFLFFECDMNLRNILEIFELLRAGRAPQRLVTGLVMSMSASCSVIVGHDRRLSRPFTLLVPEMATTAEKKKSGVVSSLRQWRSAKWNAYEW